jgi:hypothetical protein
VANEEAAKVDATEEDGGKRKTAAKEDGGRRKHGRQRETPPTRCGWTA